MSDIKKVSSYLHICLGCMGDKGDDTVCRLCGFDEGKTEVHQLRIRPRSILKDQYLIGKVLGQGGFGITYLGLDLLLHKKVAIKEFFPSMLATRGEDKTSVIPYSGNQEQFFKQGLDSFILEARNVAHFSRHINIVNVNNYFEANNTGYMVMDYLEGMSLSGLIVKRGGRLPLREALSILFPILDALSEVHKRDIYHRDISPQNIIITTDNIPVLIDFGAARQIVGEQSYSLDVVLKHGYSPLEQYTSRGKIGPWSDVYACGATLYFMITGKVPPPSVDRVESDELVEPSRIEGLNVTEELNDTILTALAVRTGDRYQSVEELKAAIEKKGYIGYRRLLEGFLKGEGVTLDHRMALDQYLYDHRLNHDDAKLIEETLREKMSLPRLDWTAEFRENYSKYSEAYPGENHSFNLKFHETYVIPKRISQEKEAEIVTGWTTTQAALPRDVASAEPKPVRGKRLGFREAAVAACVVIVVVAFAFFKRETGTETAGKAPALNVPAVTQQEVKYGSINVWSKPPVEIYVNGKLMGVSPQSNLRVPSGQVTIRLLSKQYNIDETYTEYVEPSLGFQAAN
jgi:serine/threonine protein kinase